MQIHERTMVSNFDKYGLILGILKRNIACIMVKFHRIYVYHIIC